MIAETDRGVLIVDDDPAMVRSLDKHLTGAGYEVSAAHSGSETMKLMLAQGPLLVVADWMMPKMDGL